jgi:carbon-monoxide dehydrogenase medium subunit
VDLQRSPDIAAHAPLLKEAVAHVSHPAIRNRGTIGGNLAHGDPASELPACALVLGGRMIVAGPGGERTVAADEFFKGIYETALSPQDILIAIDVPSMRADERCACIELARRTGDYALVGLAAQGRVEAGALHDLRLAYFAVGPRPTLAGSAAERLTGKPLTEDTITQAQAALADDLAPHDDLHASAATRLHLARVLLRRALSELCPEGVASEPERKRA